MTTRYYSLPFMAASTQETGPDEPPTCDICGSTQLVWRQCKLVCENCHTILKTCADL